MALQAKQGGKQMIQAEKEYGEYVSVREACEIVGVSRASLDNYARAGRIQRFEQGAPLRVLYKRSELNLLKRVRPKNR